MLKDEAVLLVVDMQEKLLPAINAAEACTAGVRKMIQAAGVLGVPMIVTEQYPEGLGRTVAAVKEVLGDAPVVEKARFSACVPGVMEKLKERERTLRGGGQMVGQGPPHTRPAVIVVGIESHVCVQQTVLDLVRGGYETYLCADAVSSRKAFDRDIAIERMRQAGAIVTTVESVIFELLGEAVGERFKQILKIVK